jgi:hypothetical protein
MKNQVWVPDTLQVVRPLAPDECAAILGFEGPHLQAAGQEAAQRRIIGHSFEIGSVHISQPRTGDTLDGQVPCRICSRRSPSSPPLARQRTRDSTWYPALTVAEERL